METQRTALENEGLTLGRYLIGKDPSSLALELFIRAIQKTAPATLSRSTLATCLRHPSLIPFLDAYDAFFRPSSVLRRHLHLMFAILEASPEFTQGFLPEERPWWYVIVIGFRVMTAGYHLIIGTLIAKVSGF
jgi:hypothetical protein